MMKSTSQRVGDTYFHWEPREEFTQPLDGTVDVYLDRWWVTRPNGDLLFFRSSPQCNSNKVISERILQTYKNSSNFERDELLLQLVPAVYMPHHCSA